MSNEQIPSHETGDALRQVSGPSIGLLVTGILGAVFSLLTLISISIGTGLSTFWIDEIPDKFADIYEGAFAIGMSFVGLVIDAFVIYAALRMKELSQWGLAVAASVLAMIPCVSPCCILGLPIGIWCLVVLMKPDVKAAFH